MWKKDPGLRDYGRSRKKVQEATHVSASFSRQRVEAAEKLPILRQGEVETAAALQRLNIELQELHNELERLEEQRMLRLSGWIKLRKISKENKP